MQRTLSQEDSMKLQKAIFNHYWYQVWLRVSGHE